MEWRIRFINGLKKKSDKINSNTKYVAENALLFSVVLYSILFCQYVNAQCKTINSFSISASRLTFLELNDKGVIKLNNEGLPYQSKKEIVTIKVDFSPQNTAFFIIDPWNNMPSNFLNQYFGKITKNYILPLVERANKAGFPVYVFTNNCKAMKPVAYSCEIPQQFYVMAKKYPQFQIVYWQDMDPLAFVKSLKDKGISNLIYTGFASNVCVIGRSVGMINMIQQGFSLFFIPEASAAEETRDTWQSQKIHKAITTIISQWMAKLIKYDDIYEKLALLKKNYHEV